MCRGLSNRRYRGSRKHGRSRREGKYIARLSVRVSREEEIRRSAPKYFDPFQIVFRSLANNQRCAGQWIEIEFARYVNPSYNSHDSDKVILDQAHKMLAFLDKFIARILARIIRYIYKYTIVSESRDWLVSRERRFEYHRETYAVARRDKIGPTDRARGRARLHSGRSDEECRPFALTDETSSDADEGRRCSATGNVRRFSQTHGKPARGYVSRRAYKPRKRIAFEFDKPRSEYYPPRR